MSQQLDIYACASQNFTSSRKVHASSRKVHASMYLTMDVCKDQQTISQDWPTEDVFINQQEISQDWPTEDVYIDQQQISEEWPTKESFKRREIFKMERYFRRYIQN